MVASGPRWFGYSVHFKGFRKEQPTLALVLLWTSIEMVTQAALNNLYQDKKERRYVIYLYCPHNSNEDHRIYIIVFVFISCFMSYILQL